MKHQSITFADKELSILESAIMDYIHHIRLIIQDDDFPISDLGDMQRKAYESDLKLALDMNKRLKETIGFHY